MCPLLLDVWFKYGDVLLQVAEEKADALAAEGAAAGASSDEEDDEEDEEEEEEEGSGGAAAAASSSSRPTSPAEVDLGAEDDEDKDADDVQLAYEALEVARVMLSKMPPTPANEMYLARVHFRLGDAQAEGDKQEQAIEEYMTALTLRSKYLPPSDRRLADVLFTLSMAYVSLASTKDIAEVERRARLAMALRHAQAAAQVFMLQALAAAEAAGLAGFVAALKAESEADVLGATFPPGLTLSWAERSAAASSSGGGAASSPAPTAGEPEIHIFTHMYAKHAAEVLGEGGAAAASSSSSSSALAVPPAPTLPDGVPADTRAPLPLSDICSFLDEILQRMADIRMDIGTDMSGILADIAGNGAVDEAGGVTTIGFGSSGAAAAAAVAAPTLAARKKEGGETAAAAAASSSSSSSSSSSAPAPLAGTKRSLADLMGGGEEGGETGFGFGFGEGAAAEQGPAKVARTE